MEFFSNNIIGGDNNNIPLDRNYYNSMTKKMNDSKGVLNDEEMSDLIKEISSNLRTNLSSMNPLAKQIRYAPRSKDSYR